MKEKIILKIWMVMWGFAQKENWCSNKYKPKYVEVNEKRKIYLSDKLRWKIRLKLESTSIKKTLMEIYVWFEIYKMLYWQKVDR